MSAPAKRRRLGGSLFLFFLVLLGSAGGLVILGSNAQRGATFEAYSTWRSEPDGASALFETLQACGFDCQRQVQPLDILPDDGALVVLIEPYSDDVAPPPAGAPKVPAFLGPEERIASGEIGALLGWVRRGGRLLVLCGHRNPLYEALGVATAGNANKQPPRRARVSALSPFTTHGRPLGVANRATVSGDGPWTVLYRDQLGAPVAISRSFEKGEVVVVADPSIATNEGLGREGNLELLEAVASAGSSKTVRFDEVRHGFAQDRTIMGYARRFGLHVAAVQLVVAFVLGIWAASRARRRIRTRGPGRHMESREFVSAMANIYARAALEQHAVASFHRRCERALALAVGAAPAELPPGELATRLRALGIQNYRGWESVHEEARALGVAGERRVARIGERRLLAFAQLATALEREVRDAARISVDQVIA